MQHFGLGGTVPRGTLIQDDISFSSTVISIHHGTRNSVIQLNSFTKIFYNCATSLNWKSTNFVKTGVLSLEEDCTKCHIKDPNTPSDSVPEYSCTT